MNCVHFGTPELALTALKAHVWRTVISVIAGVLVLQESDDARNNNLFLKAKM